jgi:hypothetical protein
LDTYGRYIPKDLIPGLTEKLPPFEISIPSFDTALPAIDDEKSLEMEDFSIIISPEGTRARLFLFKKSV